MNAAPLEVTGSAPVRLPASWWSRNRPWLLLVTLSITLPELLTGSTPLFQLLNPIAILGLLGLYGAGVLLIREAAIIWRKGWATILLLGVAYGIVEEGLATKTFFMAGPGTVGHLGVFGHFLGVNWVWSAELAIFHSIFSIALPILLVALAFPARRKERFMTPKGTRWVFLAYLATVAFMALVFNPTSFPGVAVYATTAGVALGFLLLGRWAPAGLVLPLVGEAKLNPRGFFALGVLYTFGFFACAWVLPFLVPIPVAAVQGMIGVTLLVAWVARRGLGSTPTASRLTAFAAGLIVFLLVFSIFAELFGDIGVLAVTGLVAAFLVLLYRDRSREDRAPSTQGPKAAAIPPVGTYAG